MKVGLQFSRTFVLTISATAVATAGRIFGDVLFGDIAFEGDIIDKVDQHRAGVKDDVGTVEQGGVETVDGGRTFACLLYTSDAADDGPPV